MNLQQCVQVSAWVENAGLLRIGISEMLSENKANFLALVVDGNLTPRDCAQIRVGDQGHPAGDSAGCGAEKLHTSGGGSSWGGFTQDHAMV